MRAAPPLHLAYLLRVHPTLVIVCVENKLSWQSEKLDITEDEETEAQRVK